MYLYHSDTQTTGPEEMRGHEGTFLQISLQFPSPPNMMWAFFFYQFFFHEP